MNLAQTFVDASAKYADRPAVRLGQSAASYADLDRASATVAGMLQERGLGPGDPVGVMLPNVPQFPAVYYGVLRLGGMVVPMNPLLKSREIDYYLGDSGARVLFAWQDVVDEAQRGAESRAATVLPVTPDRLEGTGTTAEPVFPVAERADRDTAVILYTSGTTGRPKGAELTHGNLTQNARIFADDLLGLTPHDVAFGGLPLFHAFGQTCALNAVLSGGACVTMLPRFNPQQALALLAEHRVTIFEGVPTMYSALLAVPDRAAYDVSSLRVCVSGGAAMPVEVLRAFEEAFGCVVLEGYGLSETSPVASFNHPDRERRPGSIGTPVRGVQMQVVDPEGKAQPAGEVGEIAIRGHNVMKGYWRRPEDTAAAVKDGWFRTGDLGRVDDDGYFYIVGRKKELIIRGGYNVYPRELEEVLHEHPEVAEAAVVGIPHPGLGEEVGAAVALKPGVTTTAEEIRAYMKDRVAAYKYPRYVWLVDELPKNATGKIQKNAIVLPPGVGES
jgi:long-chain acyl-CoA synthetase